MKRDLGLLSKGLPVLFVASWIGAPAAAGELVEVDCPAIGHRTFKHLCERYTEYRRKFGCPDGPNKVSVRVEAKVEFEPSTNLYRYQYTVFSDRSSKQGVDYFGVDHAGPILDIGSPPGWMQSGDGTFAGRTTQVWRASERISPPPVDTGGLLPPRFPVRPGASLGGFSFKSPHPPGPVQYWVTGFMEPDGMISAPSEYLAEFIMEACPESVGHFFDLAVNGITQGPVTFAPVTIDIKPGSDPNSIQVRSRGVIPVAILSTETFDATTVNPLTTRFGPRHAEEIHATGHVEDVNGDGRPDMVLHFATESTGLRCNHRAAMLSGKTKDGNDIAGADSVNPVGCP